MKFIENQNTWETCISALNELDLSSMHIHQKSTDILNESDHKKITDAIANMAKYSAKEDGTFEKSIQRPIMEDGRKGRNCRKSYFSVWQGIIGCRKNLQWKTIARREYCVLRFILI
ncbi:hypothetical protein [Pilosibacter fragilis]|uniref:hypothetical protein n=1 Tax=Pilosibacter fragilis TaxID=3078042 RepID=UPI0032D2F732